MRIDHQKCSELLVAIGLSRCGGHVGDHAGQRYDRYQHENNPSHTVPPESGLLAAPRGDAIVGQTAATSGGTVAGKLMWMPSSPAGAWRASRW
jgi:hypothetical protein